MARFTPRLTAGVGVLVAFLLLGGSAAEAVADPGRSHSDRGNSSDRGNGNRTIPTVATATDAAGRIAAMTTVAATTTTASMARTTGTAAPNGAASRTRRFSSDRARSASPTLQSWRQASPQARAATGRQRRSGIGPCRMSPSWRQASPTARANCVRVDPTRAFSESPASQTHPIGPAPPGRSLEGTVQSTALDVRQRAHARHPARRVRTAIAGPGTATGARCAAGVSGCANIPGSSTAAGVCELGPVGAGSHAATGCV